MMGAGYQVVLSDLQDMARSFTAESAEFGKLRPRMAPAPVDAGEITVNAGIGAVLNLFAALNASISDAMAEHGKAVQDCHDDYKQDDSDVAGLFNKLIEEA
jgi:hypothetical protein